MSQDFVTTLRLQLREAAEREARRGPLRRTVPKPRPRAFAFALAAAAAAAAIVLAVGQLSPHRQAAPATKAPHVVARLAIADQGGALSFGFDSLWTYDPIAGDVLRLGPDGSVAARIPVPGSLLDGWAGAGSMWALTDDRLVRIDPSTNRVVARIPLPPPTRSHGAVIPFAGSVWVADPGTLLRLDLHANRFDRTVNIQHDGQDARQFTADATRIFVQRRDGTLATLDARSGRVLGVARLAIDGSPATVVGDDVLMAAGAGIAAVDTKTGKLRWRTNLGVSRVNGTAEGLGAIWVQGTPVSGRDQLWKLDPKTGRVLAALPLSDFGATGMTTARGRLWIMSPTGILTAIR